MERLKERVRIEELETLGGLTACWWWLVQLHFASASSSTKVLQINYHSRLGLSSNPADPAHPSDPTRRPTDESNCPYGLGAGQLILKFGFPGRFRVPWLLTRVNRPARPKIFKMKKHGDCLMGLLSFRKTYFPFSNLSLKSLTWLPCCRHHQGGPCRRP